MQTLTRRLTPLQTTRPTPGRREDLIVDTMLPKCQYLHSPLELMAHLRRALAFSEDAKTFLLETLKFMTTVALIMATGVILLMIE
jgi:hypothetical protein